MGKANRNLFLVELLLTFIPGSTISKKIFGIFLTL